MSNSPSLASIFRDVLDIAGIRSKRGRPKAWERRLADWALAAKVAVPVLGALVLMERGKVSFDHVAAVALYVMDCGPRLDPVSALPLAGDQWILGEALERLGVGRSLAGEVSMQDVLDVLARYWAVMEQAQAEQRARRRAKRQTRSGLGVGS